VILVKNRSFNLTHLYLAHPLGPRGDTVGMSPRFLAPENYSPWTIVRRCFCDPMFSHLCKTAICDRRTDRQTDRQTDRHSTYRASI